jgi:AraC-like DNA-binding protein
MYAVVGFYFFGLVYVMVFRRKTQGSLFSAQPSSSPIKYERSALDAGRLERYAELIDAAMREKELFLCSDLRLSQLADAVSLPANHVSQVINQVRRKNFFDYVNGFRVEEAKRLMIDPDHRHWKLLAISLAAGFSSKSTFNKAFKDTTGLTPSSFLRSEPTDTNR